MENHPLFTGESSCLSSINHLYHTSTANCSITRGYNSTALCQPAYHWPNSVEKLGERKAQSKHVTSDSAVYGISAFDDATSGCSNCTYHIWGILFEHTLPCLSQFCTTKGDYSWLVVSTPLKNMSSSVGMMRFPIYDMESHKIHVPNHQLDRDHQVGYMTSAVEIG